MSAIISLCWCSACYISRSGNSFYESFTTPTSLTSPSSTHLSSCPSLPSPTTSRRQQQLSLYLTSHITTNSYINVVLRQRRGDGCLFLAQWERVIAAAPTWWSFMFPKHAFRLKNKKKSHHGSCVNILTDTHSSKLKGRIVISHFSKAPSIKVSHLSWTFS